MEIMIISALSIVLIFFAFIVGLHYGSKVKENKTIELPTINPVKIIKNNIKESREIKQKQHEELIEEINLENIDNYNGTGIGQKEIPKL